jgi:hypothetical protein
VKTGTIYVRMQDGTQEKWIVSGGKGLDLTREVQDYIGKPTKKRL